MGPADAPELILIDAELSDGQRADVRIVGDRIVEVGPGLRPGGDGAVIHCRGAAVLPGLHDHHCHLLATAAAEASVDCGPAAVHSAADLRGALQAGTRTGGWLRGVGYDDAVAGELTGELLTALAPAVPTRVQHRSGALWVVNRAGAAALRLDEAEVDGVERDDDGRPTGRLWRLDGWLRDRLGAGALPDLAALSQRLAALGVTGITDATPDLDATAVVALTGPAVLQEVMLLGAPGTDPRSGPYKIVVQDHALPGFAALAARIQGVRPRPVAVHSVTRESLLLILAALDEVGTVPGDRIEHAAVVPPGTATELARLGLTVVTQPSFVARRGDDYLARVDPDDVDCLWPFRSLLAAGVRVGCSSDAPYGDLSPWAGVRAAVERRAASGREVASAERVAAWTALAGYLTSPLDPGGAIRTVAVGARADVVLLDRPLAEALRSPRDVTVVATVAAGRIVHDREG